MNTMRPVTTRPVRQHRNRLTPLKLMPWMSMLLSLQNMNMVMMAMSTVEMPAVAMRPLYRARMMLPSEPSFTKKVPMTEETMHTPLMSSGNMIILVCRAPSKNMEASSIVATTVTA